MKQKNTQFRHQSLQDADSVQRILDAISDGFASGKLRISDEDGELLLHPKGLLDVRLTAEQDEGRQRINLRVSWQIKEKKSDRKKVIDINSS